MQFLNLVFTIVNSSFRNDISASLECNTGGRRLLLVVSGKPTNVRMRCLGIAIPVGALVVALGTLGANGFVVAQSSGCTGMLIATPIPPTWIHLSWSYVSGADHYEIYRSDSPAALGSTKFTYYTDSTPIPGVTYDYAVAAVDGAGMITSICDAQAIIPTETVQEFPYGLAFFLALLVPALLVLRMRTPSLSEGLGTRSMSASTAWGSTFPNPYTSSG